MGEAFAPPMHRASVCFKLGWHRRLRVAGLADVATFPDIALNQIACLSDAFQLGCRVHGVLLFSILDHIQRRVTDGSTRRNRYKIMKPIRETNLALLA